MISKLAASTASLLRYGHALQSLRGTTEGAALKHIVDSLPADKQHRFMSLLSRGINTHEEAGLKNVSEVANLLKSEDSVNRHAKKYFEIINNNKDKVLAINNAVRGIL